MVMQAWLVARQTSSAIQLCFVFILVLAVVPLNAAPGDVLVESRFSRDMDGWTSVTDKKIDSEIQLELDKGSQRVKGGETGDVTWYFSAPEKFLGDQQRLYHGILKYTLGHFIFDTTQGSPSQAVPDLILESKSKRLKLGALYVFEPGTSAKEYQVPLSASAFQSTCSSGNSAETCAGDGESCFKDADCCSRQCVGGRARWFNLKKSRPATNAELIQVLSDVSSLQIRGGYYPGGMEKTWLRAPTVTEGAPFNRSDAGGSEGGEGERSEAAAEGGRRRSDRCEPGESVTVALRPVSASGNFNIPLKRPWTHYFEIPNLPEICTDATLTVLARGELAGEGTFVGVLGEEANMLGRLFVTAGDFSEDSLACKGEENCKAAPGRGGNQSVYMAEEVVASGAVLEDSLVISRGRMVQYAADGTFKVGLFVEGNSAVPEVTVVGMRLSFRLGGCYSKLLLGFPGLSRTPDRYSGFFTSLSLLDPPVPDDAGAILVNATANLDPKGNELVVAFNALASPGAFGPEFKLEPVGGGGSRSKIVATGEEWELAVAGRFFTKSYNDGLTLEDSTRIEAEVIPRSTLAAGVGGTGSSTVKLAVLLQADGRGGGQPDKVKLNKVSLLYPPDTCLVQTLKVGAAGVQGLGDGGMIREVEYCAETWQCDSNSATANGLQFDMREECVSVCLNARQVGGGVVTAGTCFQPQIVEGACATSGAVCGCTREGKAECTLAAVTSPADGDCRCRVATACARTPQNVSYPFVFETPVSRPPVGDVTLFVTAMMPHPLSSDHWLRVRLAERDMKILGYVFASPDCSHDCTDPWTDRDPMYAVTGSIRIDHETAVLAMADGDFQFRIEIDEPRLAISCALHPESSRCGFLQPTQRFVQSSGFSELVGAITDSDTTVTLLSVAQTGITPSLFQCPGGVCGRVYIRIEDEILEATALATNTLTVIRGVGGSIASAHAVGACACGISGTAACLSAATEAACTGNGGTWTVTPVTYIDPLILPPLANYGDVVLRSITLSYATAS